MDWTVFANNLKNYRKENKLTQDDLAKRLNVSRSAISYYENGTVEPSIYFLINLANEMNCSIDNLFGFNRDVSIELPKNLTKEDLKPIEKELKKEDFEIDDPKYYLEKLKKTLLKVQRSYIELEMSKKRTDRMYDELVRTFNREERFEEMLNELTELENKFNYKFNIKNKGKKDIEIAYELTPNIEDLRNKKLKEWENQYKKNKDYKNITRIDKYGNVAAGLPSFACEEVEKLLYLPKKYFSSAYDYFALTINGDSMNKLYEDGEVIIVRKQNYVRNGDIIIACILGEATCKEYYFNEDEDKHELIPHSTNPKHKPQFYSDDEIMILGKVECRLTEILDKEVD
ncbi:SOS-response transcriptional repressor [Clostridium perfringens D str. JGS1721]|uniref:SOS-response transcriptional repressor n=1 Tax=Clostridium perfringens D str. JGS1721 TaxID=488537 RepID=B1V1H8_CLOPF|nr:S24 family peptidase [Clostridium perfringens]EDT72312.1 SOS-response transcriptional repressor [Clostridium perfringens D str. JGS1721]